MAVSMLLGGLASWQIPGDPFHAVHADHPTENPTGVWFVKSPGQRLESTE